MEKEKSRKRELENTERESEKGERRECGEGRVTVEKDGAKEVEMGEGWKWCKEQLKKCLKQHFHFRQLLPQSEKWDFQGSTVSTLHSVDKLLHFQSGSSNCRCHHRLQVCLTFCINLLLPTLGCYDIVDNDFPDNNIHHINI